jgi:hypothetical protein
VRHLHVNFQVTAFAELMQATEATLGILFFLSTGWNWGCQFNWGAEPMTRP